MTQKQHSAMSRALPVFFILVLFSRAEKHRPVFSDEIKEIIQHVHNECVGKTGVAEGDFCAGFVGCMGLWCRSPHMYVQQNVIFNKTFARFCAPQDIQNCENGIFKEDTKLKCYMYCLLEEASLVDEDEVVDYDMMVSLIPDEYYERVSKMIFGCKHLDTMDKDKCQRAFDVHKCSYEKDPDIYFLF